MRELLLIPTVAAIAIAGLVRPIYALLGYIWFALLRPDLLCYSDRPYSVVLAGLTLLGGLRSAAAVARLFVNPICVMLGFLQIPIWLSVVNAQVYDLAWYPYELYLRVILMAFLIPVLVHTEQHLRWLVLTIGLSMGILGTKFGLWGLIHGGVRFSDGYGGMIADNNDLALALCMSVAPIWYLRRFLPFAWARTLALFMMFCTMAAVIMTFSRGGAITLGVVLLMLIFRSKHKMGMLTMLAIAVVPVIYLVGDAYQERMATIAEPTQEASSFSRLALARASLEMWKDYALFGVGFGGYNYARLVERYTDVKDNAVAHNTYLQMLCDCGTITFVIYVTLLWGTIAWLGLRNRKVRAWNPDLADVGAALQVSLLAFAIGSTFLSRLTFDMMYFVLTASAVYWTVSRQPLLFAEPEEESAAEQLEPAAVS